jgi:hypothetical protein
MVFVSCVGHGSPQWRFGHFVALIRKANTVAPQYQYLYSTGVSRVGDQVFLIGYAVRQSISDIGDFYTGCVR